MKRIFSLLCCVALVMSLFSGCHGAVERKAFAIPDGFDTSREYTITFWAKNDSNDTQVQIYHKAIRDFEALYPNITVKFRPYSNYGDIYRDVITNIQTGTTPNICITYPDHIATYLTGENTVVPLDDLVSHPQYGLSGSELRFDGPTKDQIIPKFLEECYVNGYLHALPYMRSTEACYINKEYVEKLGYTIPDVLTWDFIWEVSQAAAAKDADGKYLLNGQTLMLPFIYKSTDNMMISILKQLGAGYSSPNGSIQIFNETTKSVLSTVEKNARANAFTTFKIAGYPGNYLNAGQCVFAIDSTAGATWMGCDAPQVDIPEEDMVHFETVVRPIPQMDPSNPQMISQGPSMCIFNKEDPQEVLASWLFMQFLLTNEVQIPYAQTEGYIPVTSLAQQSPVYQDYLSHRGEDNELYYSVKMDATQLALDNIDNTFVTPVFNGSASLRDAAGHLIEGMVLGVIRNTDMSGDYAEKLFADTISLYRLDQIQFAGGHRFNYTSIPTASVILLALLALTWAGIGLYAISQRKKRK